MSHSFSKEIIQERFASLPQDIQTVLTNEEATQRLQNIGLKHKLRMDKIGVLIEYTTLVSLGLVKTEEFINQLQKQLEISRESAEQIAVDVDHDFFDRMRDSLRQVQYQSTSDKRFSERGDHDLSFENDGYGSEPVRDSLINDIESDANGSSDALSLSSSDYDPAAFNQASEYGKTIVEQPAGINVTGVTTNEQDSSRGNLLENFELDNGQDAAISIRSVAQERQQKANEGSEIGKNLTGISPSFQEDHQASPASQASIDAMFDNVEPTVKPVVPGYQAPQADSNTPSSASSPVTNFKERLRSQIDNASHSVNVDPYKESI